MGRQLFWRPMDVFSTKNADRGGHSDIRMVHPGADIRFERDVVLRGHLSGRESGAENRSVLDELHVLRGVHDRAHAEMDSAGHSQILQKLLDGFGLHHRNGNANVLKRTRARMLYIFSFVGRCPFSVC